ncbi:hypothetical protein NDU88_010590 [Pleurodeles waltl]|uniref:Cystatin LXN-type domain-containing protein n=1 Tax=Pleurodeles waltl TaxID=8319 RepID=A0AAV7PYH6_PLEWA|nr:hypothetical protein NDU88_010590 [Pleurodeles waltl]
MEIPLSHYPATRAASLVANYINYRQGALHRVYQPDWVTEARREVLNVMLLLHYRQSHFDEYFSFNIIAE